MENYWVSDNKIIFKPEINEQIDYTKDLNNYKVS